MRSFYVLYVRRIRERLPYTAVLIRASSTKYTPPGTWCSFSPHIAYIVLRSMCIAFDRIPLRVSRAVQTKEGASTCVRAKFGNISAVAALLWDPKPSAGELSTRSPPSAALQQLAAACLCCCGDVPRALFFFLTYYNCCWILQVAANKRRAAYLWTGLVLLIIISRVTVAAGSMPRFYLVERCVLCLLCAAV